MRVELRHDTCIVYRDDGPKLYDESWFLHLVKQELIRQGYDMIKKRMWKDGHLFGSTTTQYLRERKWRFCIFHNEYALRFVYEDYNKEGQVELTVERWPQHDTN